MGKRVVIFVTVAIFLILSLVIVLFVVYSDFKQTCTSKECVKSANELLGNLDLSVSPCNDFHAFACRNFPSSAEEARQSAHLDEFVRDSRAQKIRQMVEEPIRFDDGDSLARTKDFYRVCMNETAIDEEGLATMKKVLTEIGGWPLLERGNWREHYFDWQTPVQALRKIGIDLNAFFDIRIEISKVDRTKHEVTIAKGSMKLLNVSDTYLRDYQSYMVEVALYFGADLNRAQIDSKEVIEFQNQLRKVLIERSGIRHADLHNPRTLTQMQLEFPNIRWVDYINAVLYPSATVTSDEVVNIADPEYINYFLDLIRRTPKRIQANFICWHILQLYIDHLPREISQVAQRYHQKRYHRRKKQRRDICLDTVREKMSQTIERAFVRRFVTDDARRLAKDVIDYIKKELNNLLEELDWLDRDAKRVAREKLASIRDFIAHTPEVPHRGQVDVIYEEAVQGNQTFLQKLLNVDLLNLNLKYHKLSEPVYENELNTLMYSVRDNTLVLPSYYLQSPFFDEHRQQYLNFGAIGMTVAYQLSNLLLEGRRYDLFGNLREWSTSQSLYNYDGRAKCLAEQYSHFYIPGQGLNTNASESKDDDVAILLGKRIAYEAYRTWSKNHDTEARLPGLPYSSQQLFWISTALAECTGEFRADGAVKGEVVTTSTTTTTTTTTSTVRSPVRVRVVGPLRNIADFAKDFACPTGSYMNIKDKCTLW